MLCYIYHVYVWFMLTVYIIWGSLCNSRHPGPRRVWMGGSELRELAHLAGRGGRRIWIPRHSETYDSVRSCMKKVGILGCPRPPLTRPQPLRLPRPPPCHPKPPLADMLNTKIHFLRKIKAPAGALNTKTPFFGKIKAPAGALNTQTEFLRQIKAPVGMYVACRFLIFI